METANGLNGMHIAHIHKMEETASIYADCQLSDGASGVHSLCKLHTVATVTRLVLLSLLPSLKWSMRMECDESFKMNFTQIGDDAHGVPVSIRVSFFRWLVPRAVWKVNWPGRLQRKEKRKKIEKRPIREQEKKSKPRTDVVHCRSMRRIDERSFQKLNQALYALDHDDKCTTFHFLCLQ